LENLQICCKFNQIEPDIMKTIKILFLFGSSAFLASCANYGYISENDVYMQAPTELNLDEDENDITSFNAFKARNKGAFEQEYKDPRVNERVRMNSLMIAGAYMPYGSFGYMNYPLGFHGMRYYDRYNIYGYRGFNSGIGFGMYGYGNYGIYSPYGYGYGHYPYYPSVYYGMGYPPYYYGGYGYYGGGYYGNGYYGNGYYGGGAQAGNSSQHSYYGKRGSPSSSSNRSSFYSNTKSMKSLNNSNVSSIVNNKMEVSKDIQRRTATGKDFSRNTNSGFVVNNGRATTVNREVYAAPAHNRTVNNSYTPNTSARRSGAVQEPRNSGVSVQPNRTTGASRNTGISAPRPTRTQSPAPRMQQTGPSGRSMSTSPGGSTRTQSPAPSSTRRR